MTDKQLFLEMINAIQQLDERNHIMYNALDKIKDSNSLEQCKQLAEEAYKKGLFITPNELIRNSFSYVGDKKIKQMYDKIGKEPNIEEVEEFFATL